MGKGSGGTRANPGDSVAGQDIRLGKDELRLLWPLPVEEAPPWPLTATNWKEGRDVEEAPFTCSF